MALDLVLCAVGFVLLYYGAEWLVKGSSSLARSFGVPVIVIGLTVVAFGTSAPEFVVSLISSLEAKSMIAVGNVFGSNICNIALVLGLAAALQPIACSRTVVKRDMPIMLLVSLVTIGLCLNDTLSRIEGLVLFTGLLLYTVMNYWFARRGTAETIEVPEDEAAGEKVVGFGEVVIVLACAAVIAVAAFAASNVPAGAVGVGLILTTLLAYGAQEGAKLRAGSRLLLILIVCAGIYGVVQGAGTVVESAERIMYALGVDEKFVGLTIVAFGTSLPELATSVVAALRREMDISIGNLVGSNVFNLLGVLGVASLVRPITIPGGFVGSGLIVDAGVMLFVCLLAWVFMGRGSMIRRWQGFVLLACYAGFLAYLIIRA